MMYIYKEVNHLKTPLNTLFNSSARIIYLSSFHKQEISWIKEDNEFKYHFSPPRHNYHYPKMPVILQSNGLPWDIGNAYLLGQLSNPTLSSMKTLVSRAIHLKYYLQYLEDTNQHFLDLPKILH